MVRSVRKGGLLSTIGAAAAMLVGSAFPANSDGFFISYTGRDYYAAIYNGRVIYQRFPTYCGYTVCRPIPRNYSQINHQRAMRERLKNAEEELYLNDLAEYLGESGLFDHVERDLDPEVDIVVRTPSGIRGYDVDIIAKSGEETFVFDRKPGRFNRRNLTEHGLYIISVRGLPSEQEINEQLVEYGLYPENVEVIDVESE